MSLKRFHIINAVNNACAKHLWRLKDADGTLEDCLPRSAVTQRVVEIALGERLQVVVGYLGRVTTLDRITTVEEATKHIYHVWCETIDGQVVDMQSKPAIAWEQRPIHYKLLRESFNPYAPLGARYDLHGRPEGGIDVWSQLPDEHPRGGTRRAAERAVEDALSELLTHASGVDIQGMLERGLPSEIYSEWRRRK